MSKHSKSVKMDHKKIIRKYSFEVGCGLKDYFMLVEYNQLHADPFVQKKLHLR